MTDEKICRECGSRTVSEAPQPLCFSCQIQHSTSDGEERDGFFFDETDTSTVHDGIEERMTAALDSVQIESEIGRGGMGIVFKGTQTKLGRKVAVKVLPPHPNMDANFTERFLKEARAMARLHHPNIVAIHDFGQTKCGLSYILMEFVEGRSLADIMGSGGLTQEDFLRVIADVAEALSFAHSQDIVHRDMKPDNILVDVQGHAKIADFGIAKVEGEGHVARLTKTHQILGTPLYMAPEQAVSAASVDWRADIYAMGVILYEGMTAKFPARELEIPSSFAAVDKRFDSFVIGLLERNPKLRTATAKDVADTCRKLAASWKPNQKRGGLLGRMFGI